MLINLLDFLLLICLLLQDSQARIQTCGGKIIFPFLHIQSPHTPFCTKLQILGTPVFPTKMGLSLPLKLLHGKNSAIGVYSPKPKGGQVVAIYQEWEWSWDLQAGISTHRECRPLIVWGRAGIWKKRCSWSGSFNITRIQCGTSKNQNYNFEPVNIYCQNRKTEYILFNSLLAWHKF